MKHKFIDGELDVVGRLAIIDGHLHDFIQGRPVVEAHKFLSFCNGQAHCFDAILLIQQSGFII